MEVIKILALMAALSGTKSDHHRPIAEAIASNCNPRNHIVITAIAFKESSFRRRVFRSNTNGSGDGGVFQLNSVHGLSPEEVTHLPTAAKFACDLLDKHYQHAAYDKSWFARYHSATPHLKQKYYLEIWDLLLTNRMIK